MQTLIQRVTSASVTIEGSEYSSIGRGLLAFVCFELNDNEELIDKFINKISKFCFFEGDSSMIGLNLKEIEGELLVISQFTLAATTKKGNKASFHKAALPEKAESLYKNLLIKLDKSSLKWKSGKFGAQMDISLVNNGPVTFMFNF